MQRLRIATRKSTLARYQADLVARRLQALNPALETELVGITTEGDRIVDRSLAEAGGKGLFVKALEQGLLDGRADIAVHSMKDVPGECAEGLHLPVIVERENPYDAFVSARTDDPRALPTGAVIGTSSPRRASQLRHGLPHCRIEPLRGNVQTRLAKLDAGECDAIVLAVAGLRRLGLDDRIAATLDAELCLPAIGQGALGIECRRGDEAVETAIAGVADADSDRCVRAERAVSRRLGGSCLSPIAAHAVRFGEALHLRARVLAPDGSACLAAERRGAADDGRSLGRDLADELLGRGANRLLEAAAGDH